MFDHGEHGHGDASAAELARRVARLEARLRSLEIWAVRVHENFKHLAVPDPLSPVADTVIGGAHPPRPPRLDALIAELIDLLKEEQSGRPDEPTKPRGEL